MSLLTWNVKGIHTLKGATASGREGEKEGRKKRVYVCRAGFLWSHSLVEMTSLTGTWGLSAMLNYLALEM